MPFYALGTLAPDEMAQVEAYIVVNGEARTQLEEMLAVTASLSLATEPMTPPSLTGMPWQQDGVVKEAMPVAALRPVVSWRTRWQRWWQQRSATALPALAGVALAIALLAVGWTVLLRQEVTRLQAENEQLRQTLLEQEAQFALITAPEVTYTTLGGLEAQPHAQGRLYMPPNATDALLVLLSLEPLPADETYQVWLIRDGAPMAAGLMMVDEAGRGTMPVRVDRPLSDFDAIGVSREPAGGSPQPTIVVLLGDI